VKEILTFFHYTSR